MDTFELLDSGDFEKLEKIGRFIVRRPCAQAVWQKNPQIKAWGKVDIRFERTGEDKGIWHLKNVKGQPPTFDISYSQAHFEIRFTNFGHIGLFPEQLENWAKIERLVHEIKIVSDSSPKVLNLFAYTGGSTLAAAKAGAQVAHVDASKTTVAWASENAKKTDLPATSVRWLVDDAKDFTSKEVRRETKYHGIILDPPTYGRGQKNQIWKIETDLIPLLKNCRKILADSHSFILLSSHTPGYTPVVLANILQDVFPHWAMQAGEMCIIDQNKKPLPSGVYCFAGEKTLFKNAGLL